MRRTPCLGSVAGTDEVAEVPDRSSSAPIPEQAEAGIGAEKQVGSTPREALLPDAKRLSLS
jgi:hypothetical protein